MFKLRYGHRNLRSSLLILKVVHSQLKRWIPALKCPRGRLLELRRTCVEVSIFLVSAECLCLSLALRSPYSSSKLRCRSLLLFWRWSLHIPHRSRSADLFSNSGVEVSIFLLHLNSIFIPHPSWSAVLLFWRWSLHIPHRSRSADLFSNSGVEVSIFLIQVEVLISSLILTLKSPYSLSKLKCRSLLYPWRLGIHIPHPSCRAVLLYRCLCPYIPCPRGRASWIASVAPCVEVSFREVSFVNRSSRRSLPISSREFEQIR